MTPRGTLPKATLPAGGRCSSVPARNRVSSRRGKGGAPPDGPNLRDAERAVSQVVGDHEVACGLVARTTQFSAAKQARGWMVAVRLSGSKLTGGSM